MNKQLLIGVIQTFQQRFAFINFNDPLLNNSFFLLMNTALGAVAGFSYWIIAARFFTPHDVGIATAIISAASLLAGISNLGLGLGITRFLHQMPSNKGHDLINASLTFASLTAIIASITYVMGLNLWSKDLLFIQKNVLWFALFVLATIAWTIAPILDQTLLTHRAGSSLFLRNLVMHILKLILVAIFSFSASALGVFSSFTLGITFSCFFGFYLLSKIRPTYFPFIKFQALLERKDISLYALGSHLGNYLLTVPALLMPILVVSKFSESQGAYYYIALMVASLLYALGTSLANSAFVEDSSSNDGTRALKRASRLTFMALIPCMVILYFIAPFLLSIFGSSYLEGLTLLRIFTLAAPLQAVMALMISYWRVKKHVVQINVFGILWVIFIVGLAIQANSLNEVGYAQILGALPALFYGVLMIFKP